MPILTPLRKPRPIPKFATLDIETVDKEHLDRFTKKKDGKKVTRFLLAGVYDGTTYTVFTRRNGLRDLVDYCTTKRFRGWVWYAHFGGGFDFRFMLPFLVEKFKKDGLKLLHKNGKPFCIKCSRGTNGIRDEITALRAAIIAETDESSRDILRKQYTKLKRQGKHHWQFLDTADLFPFISLEKLLKAFGTEIQKGKVNFEGLQDNAETREYLRRDVIGLYQALDAYFKRPEVIDAGFSYTRASTSMQAFRRSLPCNIETNSRHAEQFIRKCVYGGRVEVFKKQGDNVNQYDVRSMYPYIMRTRPVPVSRPIYTDTRVHNRTGYYRATIRIKDDTFKGPIPYRATVGKTSKLIFPVGYLEDVYVSSAELELAEEFNLIDSLTIHEGYYFEHSEIIFREFIDTWYARKQVAEDGSADYLLAKYALNSLFGKFNQKRERQTIVFSDGLEEGLDPMLPEYDIWTEASVSKSLYIIPSVACEITTQARCHLFRTGITEQTCMVDTDSDNTTGRKETGNALGEWALKGTAERMYFLAPKTYIEVNENKVESKHKGIPNKALGINIEFTEAQYQCALKGIPISKYWSSFDGFKESFPSKNSNIERKEDWDRLFIHKLTRETMRSRTLPTKDTKRIWTGEHSRPYVIGRDNLTP